MVLLQIMDFLQQEFFGNTLLQLVVFLAVVAAFVILGKIIYFFIQMHGKKLAAKTKSEFDDLLIEVIEKPLVFALFILGLYLGIGLLSIPIEVRKVFDNIIGVLIIIAAIWVAVRFLDNFLERMIKPIVAKTETKLDDQLIPLIKRLSKTMVIVLGLLVIFDTFGYDVTALIAGLGIGGLAVAFAAQTTLADAFGGISILTSKPFLVGDWVVVGNVIGEVKEIGLRTTRIKNLEGRIVTYPNSKLSSEVIENISSAPSRRILMKLTLTYSTNLAKLRKAMGIVKKIIFDHPGCSKDTIIVRLDEFAASSQDILVIYFITDSDWGKVKGEINEKIREVFEKNRISFAFPSHSVYMEKMPRN